MVDALTEAHRVLRANGILADLRPDRDPGGRRVKWLDAYRVRDGRWEPAGSLREGADYYGDYLASDHAVERVLRQELFTLERSIGMRLHTYIRDLPTLDRYLAEEWIGVTVPASTRQRLQAPANRARGGWLVIADPFRLNILRKC